MCLKLFCSLSFEPLASGQSRSHRTEDVWEYELYGSRHDGLTQSRFVLNAIWVL